MLILFKKMCKKDSIKKKEDFYYQVLPASNIDNFLIYSFEKNIRIGSIVKIDLRKKIVLGSIIKKIQKPGKKNFDIKKIISNLDHFFLSKNLLLFIEWIAEYNLISKGLVLKSFIANERFLKVRYLPEYIISRSYDKEALTKKQTEYINLLKKKIDFSKLSKHYLKTLIKKKIIIEKKTLDSENHFLKLPKIKLSILNNEQQKCYHSINSSFKRKNLKPLLLDGITGSGKTEVYFKIIADYLNKKKQILVMLPEITLSQQWIERFKKKFNFSPMIWNSNIGINYKSKIFQCAANDDPIVVVGTRSSLFIPFSNLGIIIVDEENDYSYKQEKNLIYNARDMAIVRAKLFKNPILLVTATPSLETYLNIVEKKYDTVKLSKRYALSELPKVKLINMRKEKNKIFSEETKQEISKAIKNNRQSLILVNRRGYAPISLCYSCGSKVKCNKCDFNLVFHKRKNKLICHYCGFEKKPSRDCQECGKKNSIIEVGIGVEKAAEEIKKYFENTNTLILSSDTLNKKNLNTTLESIENNEIKIIIGTQIISKGFDFSFLDKVFILDFDMWFHNSDIRTSERVFSLTQQVLGRAGRRNKSGEVFIQTYNKNNKILDFIIRNERNRFYEKELELRKNTSLPPYSKIASLLLKSNDINQLNGIGKVLGNILKKMKDLKVYGPMQAPVKLVNNQHRSIIILKANKPFIIQRYLKSVNFNSILGSKVKVKVDIDPYSFF